LNEHEGEVYAMSNLVKVDDSNFDAEVLKSDKIVLVKFGATWCGPCSRQMPILEKYAETASNVKVCDVDVDDAPEMSAKYGIRSVPALLLFKNGLHVATKIGMTALNELNAFVTNSIIVEDEGEVP
jgi:thioredoxin 1